MPRAAEVGLLDVDPDLGVLLDAAQREQAQRELMVRAHRRRIGFWDVSRLTSATATDIGVLIVSGVLARELLLNVELVG